MLPVSSPSSAARKGPVAPGLKLPAPLCFPERLEGDPARVRGEKMAVEVSSGRPKTAARQSYGGIRSAVSPAGIAEASRAPDASALVRVSETDRGHLPGWAMGAPPVPDSLGVSCAEDDDVPAARPSPREIERKSGALPVLAGPTSTSSTLMMGVSRGRADMDWFQPRPDPLRATGLSIRPLGPGACGVFRASFPFFTVKTPLATISRSLGGRPRRASIAETLPEEEGKDR